MSNLKSDVEKLINETKDLEKRITEVFREINKLPSNQRQDSNTQQAITSINSLSCALIRAKALLP